MKQIEFHEASFFLLRIPGMPDCIIQEGTRIKKVVFSKNRLRQTNK